MVKWCNEYGEMVQRIHTSYHGILVKHASGDMLFTKWQNGETVILTFISPLFCTSLQLWGPIRLLDSISCYIHHLNSGWCLIDCLIVPLADPTPINAVSPCWFWSIHFFYNFLLPQPTLGFFFPFVTFSFSPLFAVPILEIYYIISVITDINRGYKVILGRLTNFDLSFYK